MHPQHIANTIAKRRRELDAKLEMANSPLKQMSVIGEFLAEMDMLVSRIRADERNRELGPEDMDPSRDPANW